MRSRILNQAIVPITNVRFIFCLYPMDNYGKFTMKSIPPILKHWVDILEHFITAH